MCQPFSHFTQAIERPSSLLNRNRSGVLTIYIASGDGPFLARPSSVPQKPLQYFAGAALRQLGLRELDAARNFEIGERSAAICDQLFRSERFPRLENNDSLYDFTPLRIGYSENRHFAHGRMRVNHGLDFAGINILAAGDDHVFQAIENVEVPVGVLIPNVARSEEAVPEREFSFFRLVPITAHDI